MIDVNRVHQGDCLSILPTLPSKSVSCIITDPPYGIDLDYGLTYQDTFENWQKTISGFLPEALRVSAGPVLLSTSKLEAEQFLFKNYPPIWRLCWYKGATTTRSPIGFKDWESVFVYGDMCGKQTHDYFAVVPTNIRKEIPGHPCPKPIGWAKWLISHFTRIGDTILDPFAGSGTTCLAALQLNRNFIGIEINPDYCKIANKRIANHPLKLEPLLGLEVAIG
jgi:site-specific DNA-methyltransferase (adenine-specific)